MRPAGSSASRAPAGPREAWLVRVALVSWLVVLACYALWLSRETCPAPSPFAALLSGHFHRLLLRSVPGPAALLCAAFGLGRPVVSRGFSRLSPLESAVLSTALGLGALGLGVLGLGLLGGLRAPPLTAALAAGGLAGAASALGFWREKGAAAARRPPLEASALAAIAAPFLLAALVYAMVPPTAYDSLHYHLALPELFLARGRIFAVSSHGYAGAPAMVEMLYLPLLALDGTGTSCQLLNWLLGLLALAAVACCARRLAGPSAGPWAALLLVTTPIFTFETRLAYVEVGWAALVAAAGLALLRADDRRSTALAGALAGMSIGCKFQAAFVLPAAAAYFLLRGGRSGPRDRAAFFVPAALFGAPWFLKNVLLFGDPVFPFLHTASSATIDVGTLLESAEPLHYRSAADVAASLAGVVGRLWSDTFYAGSDDRQRLLSPLLLTTLPMLPLAGLRRRQWAFFALGFAFWAQSVLLSRLTRFAIPGVALLCAVGGAVVSRLPATARRVAAAAALALAVPVWSATFLNGDDGRSLGVVTGRLSEAAYLSELAETYPCPTFPVIDWINRSLPPSAKVLVSGEWRLFRLSRERIASSMYAEDPLRTRLLGAADADGLFGALRSEGVTHLYVNAMNVPRMSVGLDARRAAILRDFWARHLKLVFRDKKEVAPRIFERDAAVFELVPRSDEPGDERLLEQI